MTIIHPDDRDEFPWTAHVADLEQQSDQVMAERDALHAQINRFREALDWVAIADPAMAEFVAEATLLPHDWHPRGIAPAPAPED